MIYHINHQRKGTNEKNNQKMIQDFCSMTGASESQATSFLKRSNWNFQDSINLFFDEGTQVQQKQEIKQTQELKDLFNSLSTKAEGQKQPQIDEDKFAQFIEQYLKLDPQSLAVGHILINIMKTKKSGHITKQNFLNLFNYLRCQSPSNLYKFSKKLEDEIQTNQLNFKDMYLGTFSFYLVGIETTLDYELAVQLWKLYLKKVMPFYDEFIKYCESKKLYKVHKDLWKMVLEFTVDVKDINDVKESDGWPVFLDQFVEFYKESNKMKQ